MSDASQAKAVNNAFNQLQNQLREHARELSAMQTFLAAILAKGPEHKVYIHKSDIELLHTLNLSEINVDPDSTGGFTLIVQTPKEETSPLILPPQ